MSRDGSRDGRERFAIARSGLHQVEVDKDGNAIGRDLTIFKPTIILNPRALYVSPAARIDGFVKIESGLGTAIAADVHIASYCHIGIGGGHVIFEEGSSAGSGSRVISGSNVPGVGHGCSAIGKGVVVERSFVHIMKDATLFAGATVLPGVTIGENACVAAGAVVREDVPACEILGGIPARRIGTVGDCDHAWQEITTHGDNVRHFVCGRDGCDIMKTEPRS